jgi:protein-S-isoprenylcysteine O-methyltransferase Ste14
MGGSEAMAEKAHAGVGFPPPLVFLGFVLLGPLIERFVAVPRLSVPWPVGAAVTLAGVVLLAAAQRLFFRRGENPAPWTPTGAIVDTGLYAWTRNPMYLAMTIIAIGLSLLLESWLSLALTAVAVIVIQTQVIAREERYLSATFGEPYDDYRRRVRRWL